MDLLKALPPEEWKNKISGAYFKHGVLSKDDAKIKFLEIIHQWPTFGSAFFEVKVSASLGLIVTDLNMLWGSEL